MKVQLGTKEFNNSAMEIFGGKSKQQTAVEWLIEQLEWDDSKIARVIGLKKYNQVVSQAKEMEKQQIIDAWEDGQNSFSTRTPKQYYKETFKNK